MTTAPDSGLAATSPAGGPPQAASALQGPPAPPPLKHPGLLMVASCLGMFMCFIEVTAAISTLRAMQVDLHIAPADLSWVSSLYALVVAAVVLSGGAFGERFGRRRVFLTGVVALAFGSLVVAFAGTYAQVLVGRGISGLGGALVLPTSLAFITVFFTDPREREKKISVWVSVSGFGLALGPIIGGTLLHLWNWHAVYMVNSVLAVPTVVLTLAAVVETRIPGRSLDLSGQILAVAGLSCLVAGVAIGGRVGYGNTGVVGTLVVAAAALLGLVFVEWRAPVPMLDIRMMRSVPYLVALVVSAAGLFGFVGVLYLEVQFLQRVQGQGPLETGVRLLAAMAAFVAATWAAGRLGARFGPARLLVAGTFLTGVAGLVLLLQEPDSPYALTAAGLALVGVGSGCVVAPSTTAAIAVVAPPRAPAASGAVTAFRQVGSVLATASLGSVLAIRFLAELPDELARAHVPAPVAQVVVDRASNGSGGGSLMPPGVRQAIGRAFTEGLHAGMLALSCVCFIAMALAALFLVPHAQPRPNSRAAHSRS